MGEKMKLPPEFYLLLGFLIGFIFSLPSLGYRL
jgi:hypothetical protein